MGKPYQPLESNMTAHCTVVDMKFSLATEQIFLLAISIAAAASSQCSRESFVKSVEQSLMWAINVTTHDLRHLPEKL